MRIPFYHEPEIPDNYTERGADHGARLTPEEIDNPDMRRVFVETRDMGLQEAFAWMEEHCKEFSPTTIIIDTDQGDSLSQYDTLHPEVFLSKKPLNQVQHLNTLLNRANEHLAPGGYLWCHCRTAVLKRKMIMKRYPWGISHLIFACHYLWHRVCPKLCRPTRKLYMAVTKGKNRTYNRVEVLGRLYRAGFEVLDEEFRKGEFFVLARQKQAPIWDDVPTCSPLIKLRRVGKDGKIIGVYKFRTMYSYSEYLQPYLYEHSGLQTGGKFADDYRVNFWGRWMRKVWVDELPMFINMFKGECKLVGVRPLSRHYFSLYTPEMQQLRTKVKPGLLPPFYYDRHTPETIDEVQASERKYIEAYLKAPLRTDLRYFFGTIGNIIFRRKHSH